jgi:H+-transporting ATPase
MVSSGVELTFFALLAFNGVLMDALPAAILAGILAAAVVFAFALDAVKLAIFRHMEIA